MNPAALIARKRDGGVYSRSEIEWLIQAYTRGDVPDYQMAAWSMAVFCRGLNDDETAALTAAMLASGTTLRWSAGNAVVDKHSTGGTGDKTSLIIAPLLACCGLRVPMLSGRGLGATGGTLDKLEAIPGFRTNLTLSEIETLVDSVGCVITGASAELAPADRRLYALRDVTATVPSIPLITASIMSKKLAEGLQALVLDVKFGSGAFMKTLDQARLLAQSLLATGTRLGVRTTAVLSDMNQPLGRWAGNSIEIEEVLNVLQGAGPADVRHLSLALAAELLVSVGQETTLAAAERRLAALLDSGAAHEKFQHMVSAQGGKLEHLPARAPTHELLSPRDGYVVAIDTEALGYALIELGGGRKQLGDPLDHTVGLECCVKRNEFVARDAPLLQVFARSDGFERVREALIAAFTLEDEPGPLTPLIVERRESAP